MMIAKSYRLGAPGTLVGYLRQTTTEAYKTAHQRACHGIEMSILTGELTVRSSAQAVARRAIVAKRVLKFILELFYGTEWKR